jgi:hypothetical protein
MVIGYSLAGTVRQTALGRNTARQRRSAKPGTGCLTWPSRATRSSWPRVGTRTTAAGREDCSVNEAGQRRRPRGKKTHQTHQTHPEASQGSSGSAGSLGECAPSGARGRRSWRRKSADGRNIVTRLTLRLASEAQALPVASVGRVSVVSVVSLFPPEAEEESEFGRRPEHTHQTHQTHSGASQGRRSDKLLATRARSSKAEILETAGLARPARGWRRR